MKTLNSHREKSIARQTLRVSLGLIVFTIVLIEIISYRLISITIREQAGSLIDSGLELAASNVQNFLNKYDNLIQNIYMNQSYVENLKPINLWDNRNYANAKHEIDESLQDLCFENNDSILGIEIVGEYGDSCFYDSMSKSSNYSLRLHQEVWAGMSL
jgi:two-component system sensor histidine kinase YesM